MKRLKMTTKKERNNQKLYLINTKAFWRYKKDKATFKI